MECLGLRLYQSELGQEKRNHKYFTQRGLNWLEDLMVIDDVGVEKMKSKVMLR